MNRSIKSLMLLAVLGLGMNSFCALPAELPTAEVQAFMEAKKQKLVGKMVAVIEGDSASVVGMPFSVSPCIELIEKIARTYNLPAKDVAQFYIFKYFYDEYCSYFPQGDAEVDMMLKSRFHVAMKEKIAQDKQLRNKLENKIAQKEKGFMHNIRQDDVFAGCWLAALSCASWQLSKTLDFQGEQPAYCWALSLWSGLFSAGAFVEGLNGYDDLGREIKHLTDDILRFRQEHIVQLDQAYAYAFPGELRLSDQVGALFRKIKQIEALYQSVPE